MENTSIEIEIGWRFHNIFVELHVAIEVDEVRCALCAVRCALYSHRQLLFHCWNGTIFGCQRFVCNMCCVTLPNISLYVDGSSKSVRPELATYGHQPIRVSI